MLRRHQSTHEQVKAAYSKPQNYTKGIDIGGRAYNELLALGHQTHKQFQNRDDLCADHNERAQLELEYVTKDSGNCAVQVHM